MMSRWDWACAIAACFVLALMISLVTGAVATLWALVYALVCVQ